MHVLTDVEVQADSEQSKEECGIEGNSYDN